MIQFFILHIKEAPSPNFRDFERLNHEMLQDLINKVKSWDTDSDVDWSQWIDTEIPDGIDNLKDSDYLPSKEKDTGENSNVTSLATRKYNLRGRCHWFFFSLWWQINSNKNSIAVPILVPLGRTWMFWS